MVGAVVSMKLFEQNAVSHVSHKTCIIDLQSPRHSTTLRKSSLRRLVEIAFVRGNRLPVVFRSFAIGFLAQPVHHLTSKTLVPYGDWPIKRNYVKRLGQRNPVVLRASLRTRHPRARFLARCGQIELKTRGQKNTGTNENGKLTYFNNQLTN